MNKLIIILAVMLVVLGCVWFFKSTTPTEERNDTVNITEDDKWWDTSLLSNVKTDAAWMLDPEIPVNYIPVIDQEEVYMVLNDDGTINRYRRRYKDSEGDWVWEDIIEDDMPVSFKPVPGEDNIFSYVGANGEEGYYEYVRNGDGSYAYVETDANGNRLNPNIPDGDYIPSNFVLVEGNVYAEINEYGVIVNFWEKNIDEMGAISWQVIHRDFQNAASGVTSPYLNGQGGINGNLNPPVVTVVSQVTVPVPMVPDGQQLPNGITLSEGQTYYVETLTENKTTGGWKVTYETTYTYIYNADGSLYSTHKDGPHEVSRVQVYEQQTDLSADAGAIEQNIDAEIIRVTNGISFEDGIAASVLAGLNNERAFSGLNQLSMSSGSNAVKLATLFAADMAKYNYADIESPLYGSIEDLAARYGITDTVSINVWRCGAKSAADINTRLQTVESSRNVRMDSTKNNAGIAIASSNGFYYVVEVFTS